MQHAGAGEHLVVGVVQQIVLQCRALELCGLGWEHGNLEYSGERRGHKDEGESVKSKTFLNAAMRNA